MSGEQEKAYQERVDGKRWNQQRERGNNVDGGLWQATGRRQWSEGNASITLYVANLPEFTTRSWRVSSGSGKVLQMFSSPRKRTQWERFSGLSKWLRGCKQRWSSRVSMVVCFKAGGCRWMLRSLGGRLRPSLQNKEFLQEMEVKLLRIIHFRKVRRRWLMEGNEQMW